MRVRISYSSVGRLRQRCGGKRCENIGGLLRDHGEGGGRERGGTAAPFSLVDVKVLHGAEGGRERYKSRFDTQQKELQDLVKLDIIKDLHIRSLLLRYRRNWC